MSLRHSAGGFTNLHTHSVHSPPGNARLSGKLVFLSLGWREPPRPHRNIRRPARRRSRKSVPEAAVPLPAGISPRALQIRPARHRSFTGGTPAPTWPIALIGLHPGIASARWRKACYRSLTCNVLRSGSACQAPFVMHSHGRDIPADKRAPEAAGCTGLANPATHRPALCHAPRRARQRRRKCM